MDNHRGRREPGKVFYKSQKNFPDKSVPLYPKLRDGKIKIEKCPGKGRV